MSGLSLEMLVGSSFYLNVVRNHMTHNQAGDKEIIYVQAPQMADMGEDEIDLLELWHVLWSAKWFIMGFSLVCTLIAVWVTLFVLPVIFKSTATLQPASSESSSHLASLVGSLPFSLGLPGAGGGKLSLVNFLESRTLKERLIIKYKLLQRLYKDKWDAENNTWRTDDPKVIPTVIKAIQGKKLNGVYAVSQDKKTGLITLSWWDKDPVFAQKALKGVIAELQHYLDKEYVSDAKRERVFIEGQLAKATQELEYWERQIPREDLTLSTITRERLAAQTVYTELRKQLELAKITEAKELVTFKVLDEPFVPEKKDKPKRALICALTLVVSGFAAIFLVFIRNAVKRSREEHQPSTGHAA